MSRYYVGTSALVKRLRVEDETPHLEQFLRERPGLELVSSELLVTELRRVALRLGTGAPEIADQILRHIHLRRLTRPLLDAAGNLTPNGLRSLDAIHLATALELRHDIEAIVVYDERLGEAARLHGLTVVAPAAPTTPE